MGKVTEITCRRSAESGIPVLGLKAASLVEAVVASVIFLTVFAATLFTATRLTTGDKDRAVYIAADRAVRECTAEYSKGGYLNGKYEKVYDWGDVTVVISPYPGYPGLDRLSVTATFNNSNKRLEFNHIIRSEGD